jgi:HlyD family secretion protein
MKPETGSTKTNSISTNNLAVTSTGANGTNTAKVDKKSSDVQKPIEVVFIVNGNRAKMVPVKIGISDDNYWEITDGLHEGDEIITGGYRAISRDLDDGKKIVKGMAGADDGKTSP